MSITQENKDAWERLPFALTIADLEQEDQPLVYVNRAFEQMTGYSKKAVLGRNCRFLQGERTDPDNVAKLRRAVENCEDVESTIYNYRADGEGFWNRIVMGPLNREEEACRFYAGIQYDLGNKQEPELPEEVETQLAEVQHRVKNHLSMVVGLIRLQARDTDPGESAFDTLSRRVEALQLLYQEMDAAGSASATDKVVPLGAYLGRIVAALNHLDGRQGVKVNFDADTISVPVETAGRLGLIVSEVLTNSLRHAFRGRGTGSVVVQVKVLTNDILRIALEDDGNGMPEDCNWPQEGNLGAKIVRNLVTGLRGTLNVARGEMGTVISLDIPLDRQKEQIEEERTADAEPARISDRSP